MIREEIMREDQTRKRQRGDSKKILLMALIIGLVVFAGASQARAHSGRPAEFTLSIRTAKPAGEFALKRETNTRYPLSVAGYETSGSMHTSAYVERIPLHLRNELEEKPKGQREIVFSKPPLNQGKVIGEFIGGSVLGMATGLGAANIGASISYDGTWFSEWPGAIFGFALGYPLGCALGVYLIGNIGSDTGSFGSALGAAYGGIMVGTIGAYAMYRVSGYASAIVFLAAPPLLATFAFNKSRRYKNPSVGGVSLLNFKSGNMNLGFPTIMAFPSAPGSRKMDLWVNLASVEF